MLLNVANSILSTILLTGFTVSFFHAAIPTHWLPFVLTAKIQNWSQSKTLTVTALAGLGHVTFTAFLGFLVAWCGIAINGKIGASFPWIAGGALIAFGAFYLVQQLKGHAHSHSHFGKPSPKKHNHGHEGHDHVYGTCAHEPAPMGKKTDRAAVLSLLALLTFSPCEGFLPIYVSGVQYGWTGFVLLTLVLSVATVLGMILFTSLTLLGMEKFRLQFLADYESGILGGLLVLLGLFIIIFET